MCELIDVAAIEKHLESILAVVDGHVGSGPLNVVAYLAKKALDECRRTSSKANDDYSKLLSAVIKMREVENARPKEWEDLLAYQPVKEAARAEIDKLLGGPK